MGWTLGWTVVDAGWTVSKNFGTGWSRQVEGMVGRMDGGIYGGMDVG